MNVFKIYISLLVIETFSYNLVQSTSKFSLFSDRRDFPTISSIHIKNFTLFKSQESSHNLAQPTPPKPQEPPHNLVNKKVSLSPNRRNFPPIWFNPHQNLHFFQFMGILHFSILTGLVLRFGSMFLFSNHGHFESYATIKKWQKKTAGDILQAWDLE